MESPLLARRDLLQELQSRGVRLTLQRRMLVEILQEAHHHLDAESLWTLAKSRARVDRATVYRTLELLKKLRLVDELDLMHLNGEKHYYEAKTEHEHLHLACFECGRIEEVSTAVFERLKRDVAALSGFQIGVARLEMGGRCRYCVAQGENSDGVKQNNETRRKN